MLAVNRGSPGLADGNDPRSWYARSRSRVATGLLLTSPGIPMLFMGQEILEDEPWSDTPRPDTSIHWAALEAGDKIVADILRFARELIGMRRKYPALRGEGCAIIHVHDDNRVLAFQRWIEVQGRDVVVVCSLNENTLTNYAIGFPGRGTLARGVQQRRLRQLGEPDRGRQRRRRGCGRPRSARPARLRRAHHSGERPADLRQKQFECSNDDPAREGQGKLRTVTLASAAQ